MRSRKNKKIKKDNRKKSLIYQGHRPYLGSIQLSREKDISIFFEPTLTQSSADGKILGVVRHAIDDEGCGRRTLIARDLDAFLCEKVHFLCGACGKPASSKVLQFAEVNVQGYHLYGDESTTEDYVVYGIIALSTTHVTAAISKLEKMMSELGPPTRPRLHCRQIFNIHARDKTEWKQFNETEIWELMTNLLVNLKKFGATFFLGVVDRSSYPEFLPSEFGHQIRVLPEHLYVVAFGSAMHAMRCAGFTEQSFAELDVKLWIDPQKNKMDFWGIGKTQVQQLMNWPNLRPEKIIGEKPILLEIADVFAYTAARAVSRLPSINKERCQDLYHICSPIRANGEWGPGPHAVLKSGQVLIKKSD